MKGKLLAFMSIFFLLIVSSVAVGAANYNEEIMAGPTITFTIPDSVVQNQQFTVTATASGSNAGISMYLYRSTDLLNWALLDSNICSGTTCYVDSQEQLSVIDTYYYKATATDSGGTRIKIEDVVVYADTGLPQFSNYGENPTDPATYVDGATYTFTVDVTDNVGVDSVAMEFNGQVELATHMSGNTWQVQITDLDVNTYNYIWSAVDVNGNTGTSPVQTYTVQQATIAPVITVTPGTTVTYGTETTATCTVASDQTPELFLDGIPVSNSHVTTLDAGDYTYLCSVAATQNYAANSVTQNVHVDKANPVLSLTLNTEENDISVEFGTETTALGTVISGEAAGILTRSDVGPVINPDVATLPVNTYIYTFDYAETANYNSGSISRTLTITKISPDLQCTIDPITPNVVPNPTTITCTINNAEQAITIDRDGTDISGLNGVPMNLIAGTYVFSAAVAESANYQAATWGPETYQVLEESEAPQFYNENANPASGVVYISGATYTFSIDWIDNIGVTSVAFDFDGTGYVPVQAGNTYTVILNNLDAGNYNYEWTASDAAGNTNETGQIPYEIIQAQPEIHLTLDDGTGAVENDVSVQVGTATTAIGSTPLLEGTLVLLRDNVDIGALTETVTLPAGIYNYTLVYSGATNYADSSVTYFLTVGDTIPPVITITYPVDYTGPNFTLAATTDEIAVCYIGTATNPQDIMDVTNGLAHTHDLTDVPYGTQTYFVRCVDQFGNEAETSVTWDVVYQQDIDIVMGWNLISLSVIPVQPLLTSDPIWGANYTIQNYDTATDTWMEYDSTNPGAATLNQVVPDKGYWVYADTARTITVLGDEPGQRTVQLLTGINMIGWTSSDSARMDIALWFIQNNVSGVQMQDMSDMSIKLLADADTAVDYFEPGKGYFVNITNDTTWIYPQNIAPIADAGIDKSIYVGESVTLDGSGSTDIDGSILSYSWTVDGITKTGVSPSFTFDAVGTYTVTLTVTDDDSTTSTDTVSITVDRRGGGGQSGGGGIPPGKGYGGSGFIIIELTAPETIAVVQGTPYTFTATVTNVGDTNVYDITINGDPDWITVIPLSVTQLGLNESADFEVTVTLPDGVLGTNYLTLKATGRQENTTATSSVSIEIIGNPEQCENCEQPSEWTTCDVNGTQTRTVYTCDEGTGYNCVETTETRNCGGITGYFLYVTDNPVTSAVVSLIIVGAIGGLWYAHKKGKTKSFVKGVKEAFKMKKTTAGKAPVADKPKGIDFSIEYKKSFDPGTSGLQM